MPTLAPPLLRATRDTAQRRPGLVLAVILTVQLMLVLDGTIVNIALPGIRDGLGFSTAGLSWVINAYALSFGGLLLLGARAGDLVGRRRVFTTGVAVFTVASLIAGLAPSGELLLVARAAQGIGAALASPTALALLSTTIPAGPARNHAFALYGAVSGGGSALGLLLGGMLTSWLSWRWIFFVNVPIGLALCLAAPVVLQETDRRPGRFDLAGAITSTAAMTSLVYGFIHASTAGWGADLTVGAFVLAGLLLAAFVVLERRVGQPLTPLHLFADRNRASVYLIRLPLIASMFGMFFYLSQFEQGVLGFSALQAGLSYLPMTAALVVSSRLGARLLPRWGAKTLSATGIAITIAGMVWLRSLSATTGYAGGLLGPMLLVGFGMGLPFIALTVVAMSEVDPADAGAGSGLINVTQQVGGALGLSILVTVFQAARNGAHPFVHGTVAVLTWSAVLLAFSLVLTLVGIRPLSAPRKG